MTSKLFNLPKIALFVFAISFLLSSCTEEKYYYPEGEFAVVLNEFVTVKKNDWRWNATNGRFEAIKSYPQLTADDFDNGALVAGVFIIKNNVERLESLPYVSTYYIADDIFTETISCALEYSSQSIIFSIQASDLEREEDARQEYEFKVSIVKNFVY